MHLLISILIGLVIVLVAAWAVRLAGRELGLPPNIVKIILVVIALIFIVWLLSALGALPYWGPRAP